MKHLRVVVSGAAGLIGYNLSALLGDGTVFGEDCLIELVLHDIPRCEKKLIANCEELKDCAFPFVTSFEYYTNPVDAFKNADVIFFLASLPFSGTDRLELLTKNISIYLDFGHALETQAKRDCKCIVVANPANTLTYVLMKTAPSIPKSNFIALNRTDHNRARSIALRICREHYDTSLELPDLRDIFVWGNHNYTMFPDVSHALLRDQKLTDCVPDSSIWDDAFISEVQQRGFVLMQLRDNVSSVNSVARASVDVARDLFCGTKGERITMAVCSDGNPFGVEEGLICGFPVVCEKGAWHFAEGVSVSEKARARIDVTVANLKSEMEQADSIIEKLKNDSPVCFIHFLNVLPESGTIRLARRR